MPLARRRAGHGPDPLAINRRIDEEIDKLQQGPGVKEVQDLQRKINALEMRRNQESEPLLDEMLKLEKTPAYEEYEKKLQDLQAQRISQWDTQRKEMAAAAKQIYQARHAELARLAPGDLPGARALGFDVLTFPRLDGSTSTQPLAVILACRFLNVPYAWAYPEPNGYPWPQRPPLATDNLFVDRASPYRSMEFSIAASEVQSQGADQRQHRIAAMINGLLAVNSNTHDAYVNLINGTCDVNLTARGPSADESKLAQDKKVELELVPIAIDALVFIVHQSNPVKNLSLDQIKEIYTLQTKTWQPLGGTDKPIRPFLRESNSGSRELFDTLVLKTPTDEAFANATRNLFSGSMAGPYNQVTQEPEGIGYSVYYYEHFMALSPYTRTLAINGIEPSYETLAAGKYPLAAPVYAALRKSDPPTAPGRKIAAYLTSPEGRLLLRESGYVPAQ